MINNPDSNKMLVVAEAYKAKISPDNKSFNCVFHIIDKINDDKVYIYRFEKNGKIGVCNMFHPHITVIVDSNKKLRGYHHIDKEMLGDNRLKDKECIEISRSFLKEYANDLINESLQYISHQKFPIIVGGNKKDIINATWVKYRDGKTGAYFWVMLNPQGKIIEFDRDIFWSFFRGGRATEEWLLEEWFSKWLKKRN